MKAKKIIYEKLFNLGNYQHEKIGIEIEIEEGEKAKDVLEKAKQFVNQLDPENEKKKEYERSCEILKHKDGYTYSRVMQAEEVVKQYESETQEDDSLLF